MVDRGQGPRGPLGADQSEKGSESRDGHTSILTQILTQINNTPGSGHVGGEGSLGGVPGPRNRQGDMDILRAYQLDLLTWDMGSQKTVTYGT